MKTVDAILVVGGIAFVILAMVAVSALFRAAADVVAVAG